MKKNKKKQKASFDNDFLLRIYAIIGAVIIWFIMSITLYSSLNKTIRDVPVEIDEKGIAYAAQYGLESIDFKNVTVDVKVSGKRYEIGNLKPEDIKATVEVIGVTKAGDYPLKINISSKTKDFEIVSVSKTEVNVTFDKMMTKEFVISAEAPFYTVPTDYIQESPVATPQTVEITGPQQQIERISRVVARTENKETITSSINIPISELILYDEDNVKLDTSKFSFSTNNFYIDMKVNKVKELPFNVEIQNAPPNFDLSSLNLEYSNNSIKIAGEESVVDTMNEIHLGYIDLRKLSLRSSFTFDVSLDPGISNLSDITKVNISLDTVDLLQKTFSISKEQIHIIGALPEYNIFIQNFGIQNIALVGPEEVISKITPEDIIAEVDLSNEGIIPNNYTRAAKIYCPNYNNVWAYGVYNVTLTVSEKQE